MRYVLTGVTSDGRRHEEAEEAEAEAHQGRLDRGASFLCPVDVFEVEDERELVEGQCGANTEQGREQKHRVIARAEGDDRRRGREAGDDSRHQVMEMDTPNRAAGPTTGPAQARVGAHSREREQKREQQEQKRFAARPVNVMLVTRYEMEEVRHARF